MICGSSEVCRKCIRSKKVIIAIATFVLFVDNFLLTIVVPIIPNVLREYDKQNAELQHKTFTNGKNGSHTKTVFTSTKPTEFYRSHNTSFTSSDVTEINGNVTTVTDTQEIATTDDSVAIGLLLASKPLVQLIFTVFIGKLVNRIGYTVPMFAAAAILFISSMIFALGETYTVLLIARAIHGLGSSLTTISSLGLLAFTYPDNEERGKAMTFSIAGLSFGLLGGPIIGGVLYEFIGKAPPFYVIAGMTVVLIVVELFVLLPPIRPTEQIEQSVCDIFKDPYIILAGGSITIEGIALASIQATLPVWMYQTMQSNALEQGLAFTPCDISYLLGSGGFGTLALKIGRWICALIGIIIVAIVTFVIPFTRDVYQLIAPMAGLGLSVGMVEVSMIPHLGHIVDLRHTSVYGSVYSVVDLALAIGYLIGPSVSGFVVEAIGFQWLMWIIAIANLLYSPLLYFVRNPPAKSLEKQRLIPKEFTDSTQMK